MSHNNTSDSCRRFVSVLVVVVIGLCAAAPAQAQTDPAECERQFLGQRIITNQSSAESVFAADLDGDGDTDVLSASYGFGNEDGRIAWYENTDGLGTFGPRRVINAADDHPSSVFAADLDGDGDMDVLSAARGNYAVATIAWYENTDGLGTFGPQQVITADDSFTSVFAADLDGDGDVDVLSASSPAFEVGRIAWYENTDGLGTFGPQRDINAAAYPKSVFAADLDGDGDMDVLAAEFADYIFRAIAWYENTDGLGAFGPQRVITTAVDMPSSVFAVDLDGDGDTDVVSASHRDDRIAWYENTDGLGAFGLQRVITTIADGAVSVFAADLDGDGDIDVLSASEYDGKIAWYENTDGLGTFGPQLVINDDLGRFSAVFAVDLDGDADVDVLSAYRRFSSNIAWNENETDCNGNGVNDGCDIADGISADCTGNNTPDECETDCNENNVADSCDLLDRTSGDCDWNLLPDDCDPDCNVDGIPDACEPDCNDNGVPDGCDLLAGTSQDADGNGVPDECAFFRLVPVDPPPIMDPYPAGVEIVGSEIFIPAGGQRIWLEIKLGGWDHLSPLRTWQAEINSGSYSNGAGAALAPPLEPCVSNESCEPLLGFPADCMDGICKAGYQDVLRPDFVLQDGYSDIFKYSSLDFTFGSTTLWGPPEVDDGSTYYGGTLVLDVPQDALGTYVVGILHIWNDTFMTDETHAHFPVGSAPARITVCATEDQPPCCLPSGACLSLDPDCCVAMGGESSSTAIDCTGDADSDGIPDACDTPEVSTEIPTISTWGLAAIALLLLCGAKIAFGIRRTRRYTGLQ